MNELTIDKKAYVILPKKEYERLVIKAASKASSSKKLSLQQGRKLAYKLIDQWSKEK